MNGDTVRLTVDSYVYNHIFINGLRKDSACEFCILASSGAVCPVGNGIVRCFPRFIMISMDILEVEFLTEDNRIALESDVGGLVTVGADKFYGGKRLFKLDINGSGGVFINPVAPVILKTESIHEIAVLHFGFVDLTRVYKHGELLRSSLTPDVGVP